MLGFPSFTILFRQESDCKKTVARFALFLKIMEKGRLQTTFLRSSVRSEGFIEIRIFDGNCTFT